ncbi:MAG: hypothetical protein R2834_11065 [Rhodothermales bacterium]
MSIRIIRHIEVPEAAYQTRASTLGMGLLLLYLAIFGFLLWGRHADLLNYYYPIASLIIGFWFYWEMPTFYLGFVWWTWFLTPFVRRIIDYQLGYYSLDPLSMLTPFIVVLLTVFTFFRYGKRLMNKVYKPFLFVLVSIMYGLVIGLAQGVQPVSAALQLLEWLSPVLLGFHVAIMWHEYPALQRSIQSTFTWGVFLMGLYGIYQFFFAPGWDTLWMEGSRMTSIGHPEPMEIRVFGTLNAPGPYAMVMMAGLILLFNGKGLFSRLAMGPGYGGYLLAMVRGSWAGWILAVMYLVWRLQGILKVRLMYILGIGIVLMLPLMMFGPVSDKLNERVDTVTSLEDDGSFKARSDLYAQSSDLILGNPIGNGLGKFTFDSGIITIFYVLGWPGTGLYVLGFLLLLFPAMRCTAANTDQFTVMITSIVVSFFILMGASNQVTGAKGCIVWAFLGMTVASRLYHGSRAAQAG